VTKAVLITHTCLAIAEQCLHNVKAFSASHTTPASGTLRVGKKLIKGLSHTIWYTTFKVRLDRALSSLI